MSDLQHEHIYSTPVSRNLRKNSTLWQQTEKVTVVKGPIGFGFVLDECDAGHYVREIIDHPRCSRLQEGDILLEVNEEQITGYSRLHLCHKIEKCVIGAKATFLVHRKPQINQSSSHDTQERQPASKMSLETTSSEDECFATLQIHLVRQTSGFGFRIIGGAKTALSQATVGSVQTGGAADGKLKVGDEIMLINGESVSEAYHSKVIDLMTKAAEDGKVVLTVQRKMHQSDMVSPGSHDDSSDQLTMQEKHQQTLVAEQFSLLFPLHPEDYESASTPPQHPSTDTSESASSMPSKGKQDVCLERPAVDISFGFAFRSKNQSSTGAIISYIYPDSPACKCKQLFVGDEMLKVNLLSVSDIKTSDILALVQQSGTCIYLTVQHQLKISAESSSSESNEGTTRESSSLSSDGKIVLHINMCRVGRSFGFTIRGGAEYNCPISILRITEDGTAQIDGRLKVDDELLEINGSSTVNMLHTDAITLIKQGGSQVNLVLERKQPEAISWAVGSSRGQETEVDYSLEDLSKAYTTMVKCGPSLTSAMSRDPQFLAAALFSEGLISQATLDETVKLNETKSDKGRRLYIAVLDVVKVFPDRFADFLHILRMKSSLYSDILVKLDRMFIVGTGSQVNLVLERKQPEEIDLAVGSSRGQETEVDYSLEDLSKAYTTMVKCGPSLTSAMSRDPQFLAAALFSDGLISQATLDETVKLNETKSDKGRRLYIAVLDVVKMFPDRFADFLHILRMKSSSLYSDILVKLDRMFIVGTGSQVNLVLERKQPEEIVWAVGSSRGQETEVDYSLEDLSKAYTTMVKCGPSLTSAMSRDPQFLAAALFSEGLISQVTLEETVKLNETKSDKGRRLYIAVLDVVKVFPDRFVDFLRILRMKSSLYSDILVKLDRMFIVGTGSQVNLVLERKQPEEIGWVAHHVKAPKMSCKNVNSGCKWVGELGELDTHLQTCEHALLPCTNECKDRDQITEVCRGDFQEHLTNECPRRPYQCPHCEEIGEYQERTTAHLEACPKVKLPCPDDQCELNIPRYQLPIHQSTCDFEPVSCKYAAQTIDEGYSMIPADFKDENNPLELLHTYTQAVCEQDMKSFPNFDTKSIKITAPFCFKLTNYQRYKDEDQVFYSPPFYTSSRNGYRMCLEVYPNGNGDYRNNYVSIFACLMKGDNDNLLSWPFTGKVTFELLNQLEDKNHHKRTARFDNIEIISKRVMNDGFGEGGGIPGFKFHPELDYQPDKNCQYLKDDTLIFRVSVQVPNQEPNFDKFSAGPIKVCQILKFSAKLPFINSVEVLRVSSKGGQYRDDSLGLCIDVPEGAVPNDSLLVLEVGMCLYGPFKFPGGLNPIAPILILCPQNDIELRKSVRVTLPHIIEDADNSDIETLGVQVIKADHDGLLTAGECIFNTIIGDSDLHFHTCNENGLVTFSLPHFCFVTLRASSTREVTARKGYCICPLLPPPKTVASGIFTYYLCVTYFMDPCLETIKDQFSQKGFELYTSNIKRFNFNGKKKCIQAKLNETQCGWIASLSSADEKGIQVIDADSVDLWCKEEDELKLEIKSLIYPPSFQVTAIGQKATAPSFLTIHFTLGEVTKDCFFITLPLCKESFSSLKETLDNLQPLPLTVDLLLEDGHIEAHQLQQRVQESDLLSLAELFDTPSLYFDQFGLTRAEQADVKKIPDTQEAMSKLLGLWRRMNPLAATFGKLLTIVLSRRRGDIALEIGEYLTRKES